MMDGQNIWVLKPNDFNRGWGVNLFNSIDQLKKLIEDYTTGVELQLDVKPEKDLENAGNLPEQPVKSLVANPVIKSNVFVIQKYIEKPMLINERKFDIRMWVLITHDHRCFCFKEGYIRMSSHEYNVDQQNLENLAIHLTNNAI